MAARYLKTYATSAMRSLNRVRGPATDPLSDYEFDDDDGEEKRWMTTPVVSQQTPVQRTPVVNQKTPVQRDAQQVQEDIQNVVSVAPQEEEEEVQDEARAAPQEKEESEDEEIQDEIRVVQEGEEEDGEQVVVKQEGVEAESDDDMEHQVTPGLEEGQEIGPGTGEEAGPRLDDEVTPGLEEDPAPGPEVGAVVPAATPMEAAVSAISSHSDPGMIAAVDRNTTALNRLAAAQEEHNRLLALQLEPLN
ncbi:hypothetical protein F5X68DRAFT_252352 [Plectosphaerella plurivora]|uniref:Uncharacterized protein n=1 Tax=Plectosphaerella plurivora TaxID=936078 RepID=A0A9P8VHI7_9PEZI|nr:hypothetical protein F5X68DRAFT_252352 [Plectosphaerella plurivora]